jgi:hypothetical protein
VGAVIPYGERCRMTGRERRVISIRYICESIESDAIAHRHHRLDAGHVIGYVHDLPRVPHPWGVESDHRDAEFSHRLS